MKAIYLVCKSIKIIAGDQAEAVNKFFELFPEYQGPLVVQWQNWVRVPTRLSWAVVNAKGIESIGTAFSIKRRAAALH